MVDAATVALSAAASFGGLLVSVLLERRQETLRRTAAAERLLELQDGRLRTVEQRLAAMGPSHLFLAGLAEKQMLRKPRGRQR